MTTITKGLSSDDFLRAVYRGDLDTTKKYIENGSDIAVRDKSGAIDKEALKFFSIRDFYRVNSNALHLACRYKQLSVCEYLCAKDKDHKLIKKKSGGYTALEIAAAKNQPKHIEALLKIRATYSTKCLGNVFYRFISIGNIAVAQLILNSVQERVQERKDSLRKILGNYILSDLSGIIADYTVTNDKIMKIINMYQEYCKYNKTPLCMATSRNDVPTVKWLLEKGASVKYYSRYDRDSTVLDECKPGPEVRKLLEDARAKEILSNSG